MAKQKLVAKVRFDDGSKRGEDGKSKDYEIGEAYQGSAEQSAVAESNGFLCLESDLKASKEVLDAKDKMIRELQDKLALANKKIDQLQKDLDAAGAPKAPKKKGKKGAAPDESGSDEEQ